MATIKATTIDAIPDLDANAIGDDLNILIQSDADTTKTNKTTLKNLKTYFGVAGSDKTTPTGNGSSRNYVINEFNLGEFASERSLVTFTAESGGGCAYHSEEYTTKCDQEVYAHLDVALTCTADMWSYQDSYIAIELKMRNQKSQDQSTYTWYKICQKPLCDCGKQGVRSIDFHMCLQGDMTIRATVFGGKNNTTTQFGLGSGTQLNLVITSLQEIPQNDYSTYLYVSSGNPTKTITSDLDGDFAVGVWALGTSSVASNMNITISTGGNKTPVGRVATYQAKKDIGEVYIGSFYFTKGTKVTIGLNSDKYTTTTPVYLRIALIKDNMTTSISEIKKVTSGSADSLKIEASGDFALTGIAHGSQYDTVQFHSDHSSTGVTEFNGEFDVAVIESKSPTTAKLGTRTLYYQDVFTNFCNGTLATAKNDTITSIRFNKSYEAVGDRAFQNCTALTAVDFASSKTSSIGKYAFSGCSHLGTVNMANASTLTSIGSYAFGDCSSLTTVNFSNSTSTIDTYAFNGCTSLTKVFLPIGVNTINGYAFKSCTGLKEFYIPYNFTSIASTIFDGNAKFAANGNQLYIIIPESIKTKEDAETLLCDGGTRIKALDTLYDISGFLKNKIMGAILAWPDGTRFYWTNATGTKYNGEFQLQSKTDTGKIQTIAAS